MTAPFFVLGRIVATPRVLDVLTEAHTTPSDLLRRHQRGDWGEIALEDARENERSLKYGVGA